MNPRIESHIESCLAYHVLRDPAPWIGTVRPRNVRALLDGASSRVSRVTSYHQVYGVLNQQEFYGPLVAATGRPTRSITWAEALEFTHLDSAAACTYLLELALDWHRRHGPLEEIKHEPSPEDGQDRFSEDRVAEFFEAIARRPGMSFGSDCGWMFHCFLTGLTAGGDWLGAPPAPALHAAIDRMRRWSTESYGSPFAAFRLYDAPTLLRHVFHPRPGPDLVPETGN